MDQTKEPITERGTIIIVSRNNLHLTKKAVASALTQDMPCDVVLVDNQSTDGTVQWANAKSGLLVYLPSWKQVSLSACWNSAIKFLKAEHILVLNNDVEIQPCTYRYLLAQQKPFVSCVSVDKPEQLSTPPFGILPTRPHPDFSCFLIRKECWERVGPFDESYYPAYCEDNDYHVRMHRAGIEAVCVDLPFLHHGAGTIKNATVAERRQIERGAERNRQRFFEQYGCWPGTKEYEDLFVNVGRLPLPRS